MKGVPLSIKVISWLACLVVLGTIVWSIMVVGGPETLRARRADDNRINDLGSLSNEIDRYYQRFDKVPPTLENLLNRETYLTEKAFIDSETGAKYLYEPGEGSKYRLGAVFARDYDEGNDGFYGDKRFRGYKKGEYWFDLDAKSNL